MQGRDNRRADGRGDARRQHPVTIEGRCDTVKGAGGHVDTGQNATPAMTRNGPGSASAMRMAILPSLTAIMAKQPSIVDKKVTILAGATATLIA
jgi:hypothetical protein